MHLRQPNLTTIPKLLSLLMCFTSILLFWGCEQKAAVENAPYPDSLQVFKLLEPEQTNISFRNDIPEDEYTNPLVYEYTYNGGGVAIGDVNGDGLDDIYFTANKKSNKLYLNKGNRGSASGGHAPLKFEDVTDIAGVAGEKGWKTGVTMADVNGDGLLDIYVCRSGNLPGEIRQNQLYINQGNDSSHIPVFKEQAALYGLADSAFSTHAAFFDYDRDDDLDMILLNHSPRRFNNLDDTNIHRMMNTPDALTGVKLYSNDQNHFKDITASSGINNTRLSYGLGLSIADVNNDGWPDIYLSNDYLSPDCLYINNGDGIGRQSAGHARSGDSRSGRQSAFSNQIDSMLGHTSQFSMGNDVADINNDGLPDIFTLDMLPEDNRRQKLLFANDNYELFALRHRTGLHKQYMRNMLHLGNGDETFSEIAQLAGISNTDWSWAPLFADYDNDGWKDLFITNGYVHDYTNMDFLKYMSNYVSNHRNDIGRKDLLELVLKMPSSNVTNYIFKNNGGITFTKMDTTWGINIPSNSNGAAYADLDNDGDLDLVINNINDVAFIYRNDANQIFQNNYLSIKLEGEKQNRFGVGAKVTLYSGEEKQVQQQLMSRGFQSSVSPVLHFGLGKVSTIDSVHINWQSGKQQWLSNVKANQRIVCKESDATEPLQEAEKEMMPVFAAVPPPVLFVHEENGVNDFKRQPLMTNTLSYSGPCMAAGDMNGDGLEDFFIGGATGQAGSIFLQQPNGQFKKLPQLVLQGDRTYEDTDAVWFDADGDGDLDLYICSGGYDQFLPKDPLLQDRLYINDGNGTFRRDVYALPLMYTSSSCVSAADINGDGYMDLFLGGRVIPGRYPEPARSYILINDGTGRFTDETQKFAPELVQPGMITDAVWVDMNGDKNPDLITAGEWMPIQVWINDEGKLVEKTIDYFEEKTYGWWNKLLITDLNEDGKMDIVAGNMGLNAQIKASVQEPAELYYKDFDGNGSVDPILCFYIQGKPYPYVSRDELLDQMSIMRSRFTSYERYADAQLTDIFTEQELEEVNRLQANNLKTTCFISTPAGKYQQGTLPLQAQYAPVFAMEVLDYNGDGKKDLLLGGNISHARIRMGNYDANYGILLKGDGEGSFEYIPQTASGICIKGDIRSFSMISDVVLVGINGRRTQAYKLTAGGLPK